MRKGSTRPRHNRLLEIRLQCGMSRRYVAERLGVTYNTVYHMEMDEYPFTVAMLKTLAGIFEVAPADIDPSLTQICTEKTTPAPRTNQEPCLAMVATS